MNKKLTLAEVQELRQRERIKKESLQVFNELNSLPVTSDVILTCDKVAEWLKDGKESPKSIAVGQRIQYLEKKIEDLVYSTKLTFELLGYIGFLECTMYVLIEGLESDNPIYDHLANQVANIKRRYKLAIL
ncbi:MAG: hypothetical protein KAS32_02740 [Candidatus Peribacteraceae bacterium]|nr:hypothetical protein [Candidatus Peribacteraceae bacterium]